MGASLGRTTRVSEWIFPPVLPTYDASHSQLVHFPVEEAGVDAPAMLLGRDLLSEDEMKTLGSIYSTCVIYFHSNGCDIGQCLEDLVTLRDGALDGDAAMFCPEYPGYGLLREFVPSVAGINLVARAAFRYCTVELGFEPRQIFLWGRSIGSGPAMQLAHDLARELDAATDIFQEEVESPQVNVSGASSSKTAETSGNTEDRDLCCGADAGAGPTILGAPLADESAGNQARGDLAVPQEGKPESPLPSRGYACPDAGMNVVVLQDLRSDSASRSWLKKGDKGIVVRADEKGDTLVDFQRLTKAQWIFSSNTHKLRVFEARKALAGVVLLAPLISVNAVIRYHVPSHVAASLVGPMWEVLEMAKDEVMQSIPLLVVHPKNDEIVPRQHGEAIFEQAACVQKFGLWLCNATHNIALDEDHLRIARSFLSEVRFGARPTLLQARRGEQMARKTRYSSRCVAAAEVQMAPLHQEGEDGFDEALLGAGPRLLELGLRGKAEETIVMSL